MRSMTSYQSNFSTSLSLYWRFSHCLQGFDDDDHGMRHSVGRMGMHKRCLVDIVADG
jgi:hypothetical protein